MPQLVMTTKPNKEETSGYIFDIQGLSVHDGPGCRTLIFLSGCTLNCFWCSNPEGISKTPVPMHFISKCILCSNCLKECPKNAIKIENNKFYISRELCSNCIEKSCISKCYTDGLRLSSYEISLKKLLKIIQRDRQFWGNNGGITLTGGEPLLQINFAKEILKHCHESYIHTAIETCGNIPYENLRQVIPFLDWIFFDLKHFDPKMHKSGTKSANQLVIENAKRLSIEFEGRLIFRLPVIPKFNDSNENIESIISFLDEIAINEINILPLHHLGREKYPLLNMDYKGLDHPIPTYEELLQLRKHFTDKGINCYIGSNTPF